MDIYFDAFRFYAVSKGQNYIFLGKMP